MKRLVLIGLMTGVLFLSGCIITLNPLYTEDSLIYDPGLIGIWGEENMDETWEFREGSGKGYQLIHVDENGLKASFDCYLLSLKGNMFMDIFPVRDNENINDLLKINLLPVHSFFRVLQIEPELQMATMQLDWLKKQVEVQQVAHHFQDDRVLLTGSTTDLQQFIIKNLQNEAAWEEPSHMIKFQ